MKLTILIILLCFITTHINAATQMDTIHTTISASAAFVLVDSNKTNPNFVILDVRTAGEYNTDHIAGSINIDYYSASFSSDLDKLDKSKTYLMHCASGGRSATVFTMMINKKFAQVYQLSGGFNAWKYAGYPTDKTTEIASAAFENNYTLYPNPAHDILYVNSDIDNNVSVISITNALGQVVITTHLQSSNTIDIASLQTGYYFMRIESETKLFVQKFIKN